MVDGRWRGRLVVGLLATGVAAAAAAGAICIVWVNWSKKQSSPTDSAAQEQDELQQQEEEEDEDLPPECDSKQSTIQQQRKLTSAKSLDSGISSLPNHGDSIAGNNSQLSKDIAQKHLIFKQNQWTRKAKENLRQELEQLIKEARLDQLKYPIGVIIIGDSMCDLALNNSDLDLCLLTSGIMGEKILESLAQIIHEARVSISQPLCINSSIISFHTQISNRRSVQVNLVIDDSIRIRISHLLACYATVDDRFAPLYCVIKLWAKNKGLMGRKGLTDQAIAYLLIHFLQTACEPPVLPCLHTEYHMLFNNWSDIQLLLDFRPINYLSANNDNLGTLLIGFMHYYWKFNFCKQIVSIKRARFIHRSESDCKDLICIQAPFPSHKVNVAKKIVKEEFLLQFQTQLEETWKSLIKDQSLRSLIGA